jgi:antitoxin (DNA-binding transcriptional repressor) of toxin-antitoxin stability system
MYHMERASVRQLRYSFKDVEAKLAAGEEIELVKRNKVIGHIVPVTPPRPPKVDFRGRVKKIFGDKKLPVTGAELVSEGRGDY